MVLEDFFKAGFVRSRPYLAFFFGFFFSIIAFVVAYLFFRQVMSVAMVFLTTVLLVPAFMVMLKKEEKIEGKYGLKHFFVNHKDIFELYLFSFLGVFLAFILIGLLKGEGIFAFEDQFSASSSTMLGFVRLESYPAGQMFANILFSNLLVLLICFILSFFYGASAIFLIILNGGVFAHFILVAIKTLAADFSSGLAAFGIFFLHLVPEVSGFLLAAIAGGVVSKSVTSEKFGSERFRNVFKDGTMLLLVSAGLILAGALLEVLLTARLFQSIF